MEASDHRPLQQEARTAFDAEIVALLERLLDDLDPLVDHVVERFRAEIPSYAGLPQADLRPAVRSNIERATDALRRGGEPTADEARAGRALGELRARQGLPVEALLQAHRIGVREAIATVRDDAAQSHVGAEVVLELATRAWAWADVVMLAAAQGHRDQELDLASHEQQQRAHLLRALLHGLLEESGLRSAALAHGIDPVRHYVPLCAAGPAAALRNLERRLNAAAREAGATVLAAPLDDGLAGLIGAEAPATLTDGLSAGDVTVAVGMPARPAELSASYVLTRRALEAASALGRSGTVTLPDVALYIAVLAQPEISALLHDRHVKPLENEGEFGHELISTLEAWFAHGMRTDETAAALPVHPNTLRHRLRRAEEVCGMSLSTTAARFEMWWALVARRMSQG